MHDRGQSDGLVVPEKLSNNALGGAAEMVEERGPAEENAGSRTRPGRGAGLSVSSGLDRVRQAAQKDREARFTALLHHVDVDRLRAAYRALNPKAATGVDGVTWEEYGRDLEDNLKDLHARLHRGAYRAKPSRRVFIPKADGWLRPLGVAALEDKVVQRPLVEVLNAVYETDFLGFSYGFRPGRGQHDALDALAVGIKRGKVNWVLDLDIQDYFSSLDQSWLLKFIEHRIADKRVLHLIQKWLKAGVIEDGIWSKTEEGTPQGASISTLLANVYLHHVFDLWAHQWRSRYARGEVTIVRFADDLVVGFQYRDDAERFWGELRMRLAEFALELNAEKTRLIEFGRFAAQQRKERGLGKPETSAMTPKSKARAQCGNSARWDLCGGQPEPTKAKGCPYRNYDPMKANESEPWVTCRNGVDDIKSGSACLARDESGGSLLTGQAVSGMYAARAWVRLLYGTWEPVVLRDDRLVAFGLRLAVSGKVSSGRNREGQIPVVGHRGGPSGSSVEGPVMGLERSGRAVQARLLVNHEVCVGGANG
jgi:RNA-directed DNA polymerase